MPGHIVTLINAIKPAVEKARKNSPEHVMDESIRENVRMQVEQLKNLEPLLSKRVKENSIRIIGAVYNLSTGQVEFFE